MIVSFWQDGGLVEEKKIMSVIIQAYILYYKMN